MRDYGIEPQVWGGDPDCEHEWGDEIVRTHQGGGNTGVPPEWQRPSRAAHTGGTSGSFCLRCGAWRGSLGLEPTPELYVQHLVEIFREVRRTLRDDGTLWLNLGSSYWGGKGKSGYELPHEAEERRAKGEIFQAAHNVPGYMDMRPADGRHPVFKPKDLVPIPWMVAMALQRDGWWLRSDVIWEKPNCMPSSVRDRPTTSHEYIFLLAKSKRYFYDQDAVREPLKESSVERNQYAWNSQQRTRSPGEKRGADHREAGKLQNPAGRNKRTVWTIPTKGFPGSHFAVFPEALVEPCIKAGTSERGQCPKCGEAWIREVKKTGYVNQREPAHVPNNEPTKTDSTGWSPTTVPTNHWQPACDCDAGAPVPQLVFDPFIGSGTTGLVAMQLDRNFFGCDNNPEYVEMALKRLELYREKYGLRLF